MTETSMFVLLLHRPVRNRSQAELSYATYLGEALCALLVRAQHECRDSGSSSNPKVPRRSAHEPQQVVYQRGARPSPCEPGSQRDHHARLQLRWRAGLAARSEIGRTEISLLCCLVPAAFSNTGPRSMASLNSPPRRSRNAGASQTPFSDRRSNETLAVKVSSQSLG
jgi:hypothetical protein